MYPGFYSTTRVQVEEGSDVGTSTPDYHVFAPPPPSLPPSPPPSPPPPSPPLVSRQRARSRRRVEEKRASEGAEESHA